MYKLLPELFVASNTSFWQYKEMLIKVSLTFAYIKHKQNNIVLQEIAFLCMILFINVILILHLNKKHWKVMQTLYRCRNKVHTFIHILLKSITIICTNTLIHTCYVWTHACIHTHSHCLSVSFSLLLSLFEMQHFICDIFPFYVIYSILLMQIYNKFSLQFIHIILLLTFPCQWQMKWIEQQETTEKTDRIYEHKSTF